MCMKPAHEIRAVEQPFPLNAQSIIALRSTFHGGAVLVNKVFNTSSDLIWSSAPQQEEARALLNNLKNYRAQRSVSLL